MSPRATPPTSTSPKAALRQQLMAAATELFRRQGFVATTVDEICAHAGATKGAFFHHFASKEALAEACLAAWNEQIVALGAGAAQRAGADPLERALALLDFYIESLSNPRAIKSCLAGTTVQEVSETHPALRRAANDCFVHLKDRLKAVFDDACRRQNRKADTEALATLWIAAVQGAFILYKASRDASTIPVTLRQVRAHIAAQLQPDQRPPRRIKKR
jgi:TetR/AcrR family transcriptional repressor of nem operon